MFFLPPWMVSAELLAHAFGSFIVGLLVIVLDLLSYLYTGSSLLKLRYDRQGFFGKVLFVLAWAVGAGIGGYLGGVAGIVALTPQGSIAVGVGWPAILPRLLESSLPKEEEQEPIDGGEGL